MRRKYTNEEEMKFAIVVLAVVLHSSFANAQCTGSLTGTECPWSVEWTVRGDMVDFVVSATTSGWVAIGFSGNDRMTNSDIIVGAADSNNPALSFVSDRFAPAPSTPLVDTSQDVTMMTIEEDGGQTTMNFTRARNTGDSESDLTLDMTTHLLWATGSLMDINQQTINYHGNAMPNCRGLAGMVTFPTAAECPAIVPEATSMATSLAAEATTFSPMPAATSFSPIPAATSFSSMPAPTTSSVPSPSLPATTSLPLPPVVMETPSLVPSPSPTPEPSPADVICENSFAPSSTTWIARWTVHENNLVQFTVSAETTNWVAIGFSFDDMMPNTDIVVGAIDPDDPSVYFVSDRFAISRNPPSVDESQDISNLAVTLENGVTTISFVRPLNTTDRSGDFDLDQRFYMLWAIGGSVNNFRADDPNSIARHADRSASGLMTLCEGELVGSDSGIVSTASTVFIVLASVASLLVTMLHL